MATSFRVEIGKIGLFTFIRSPGIPERIAVSPFWFWKVHPWWSGYIICKFVGLGSSNSGVY